MTHFDESQNGNQVRVAVGETFELILPENPTTGFRWVVVSNGGPVCLLERDNFDRPSGPPGKGGMHHWQFRVAQAGETCLELAYRRSWEPTAGKVFKLQVVAA